MILLRPLLQKLSQCTIKKILHDYFTKKKKEKCVCMFLAKIAHKHETCMKLWCQCHPPPPTQFDWLETITMNQVNNAEKWVTVM